MLPHRVKCQTQEASSKEGFQVNLGAALLINLYLVDDSINVPSEMVHPPYIPQANTDFVMQNIVMPDMNILV